MFAALMMIICIQYQPVKAIVRIEMGCVFIVVGSAMQNICHYDLLIQVLSFENENCFAQGGVTKGNFMFGSPDGIET